MDSISKLVRFAYLGTVEAYYASPKNNITEEYLERNLNFIKNSLTQSSQVGNVAEGNQSLVDPLWPLTTIKKVLQTKTLLRNKESIMILAYCASKSGNMDLCVAVYKAAPEILKDPNDFFLFIFYVHMLSEGKGFGRGLRKAIHKWYAKKSAMELAEMLGKNKKHYGWSHYDIISLSHMKFDDSDPDKKQILLTTKKRGVQIIKTEENMHDIENYSGFKRLCDISRLKVCECEKDAAELIRVHKYTINHLPVHLLKTPEVWEALLPTLKFDELLKYIPYLNDSKLLKTNSNFAKKFCSAIVNATSIQQAKVHPLEVLYVLKQHETETRYCERIKEEHHKKKMNCRKITKNPFLIKKLETALQESFLHFPRTGLKYFITLNLRRNSERKPVFGFNILSTMEVSVLMALALLKREKDVTIMVFTGNPGTLAPLELKRDMTFESAMAFVKGYSVQSTIERLSTPLTVALQQKRKCDVFLTFVDSVARSARDKRPPTSEFEEYRRQMGRRQAKYIIFNMCRKPHDLNIDSDDFLTKGILEICGFNLKVPKLLEAFVKNQFY